MLLQAKADPSLPNQFGRNPLDDGYRERHREVTQLLELWKKEGTENSVARGNMLTLTPIFRESQRVQCHGATGKETMQAAVRKRQPYMLEDFIRKNKSDFLMKTHVGTAELTLGEIIKQQVSLAGLSVS